MARNLDPKCRQCRREGEKLFLKGEKCFTDKCAIERRSYAPGQHGQKSGARLSDYGVHLRAKQKIRRVYGVLEGQFRKTFAEADRRKGQTGENLLQLLEARLDSVAYRMGFGASRAESRQVVRHNGVLVNGKRVNIPSYQVKAGDVIEVIESSRSSVKFSKLLGEEAPVVLLPSWLERDKNALKGTVTKLPVREDIDVPIAEHLIVELYSK